MSLKLEMLRCFCTVAQSGNLAEAASRLGRTQSAVSMTLKQFEEHLGKRLFLGERKNQLSPLGAEVFALAQNQVRQFDDTVQSIEALAKASQGLIRIVSVPSVAALLFPSLLDHLSGTFPSLKIELRDTDTRQVLDSLTEGRADVGIASGHHPLNGIRAEPLFQDRFGLVAAADHALITAHEPPTLNQVAAKGFVHNSLCQLIENPGFEDVIAGSAITVHNTHSLIAMVATGRWVTILPETVARFLPENTAFRPIEDLSDVRDVYLYTRERTQFPEVAEECRSHILNWPRN